MPIKIAERSAAWLKNIAKKPGLHAVGGVAGLQLQAQGNGTSWILRTTVGNKRRDIGLGGYPEISLSVARDKAREVKAKIASGVDPVEERRDLRAALAAAIPSMTFNEAARRTIDAKSAGWKNAKHAEQWRNTLATYASPIIGNMPVDKIEIQHIQDVLNPIWNTKNETARRVRGRIETVLDWAIATNRRSGLNPARWKGSIQAVVADKPKAAAVKHHAALPYAELPQFMRTLSEQNSMAARSLEFAILTAARSGEARGAKWSEIDLDRAVWTVPAERMKAGKEHRVPLSPRAMALLEALPRIGGTGLVFPSPRGKVLCDVALKSVIKRTGATQITVHGFRSTFRDWAGNETHHAREVIEHALAHLLTDKTEAAYQRSDLFAKRARVMADWAKFINTMPANADNVVTLRQKA